MHKSLQRVLLPCWQRGAPVEDRFDHSFESSSNLQENLLRCCREFPRMELQLLQHLLLEASEADRHDLKGIPFAPERCLCPSECW